MAEEKKQQPEKDSPKKGPTKKEPRPRAKKQTTQGDPPNRVYRSSSGKMIGGVCSGFAQYFNIDPLIIRVVWAIAAIWGGVGIVAYIVSWIVIPENPSDSPVAAKEGSGPGSGGMIWGMVLIVAGCLFLFRGLDFFDFYPFHFAWDWGDGWPRHFRFGRWDLFLPVLIIGVGIFWLINVLRKSNDSQSPSGAKSSGGKAMEKKLTRSVKDKMIGGVCGGVAEYFNIDPSIVRVLWAILTLAGFPLGIIAYIVMMIVVPEESAVESSGPPTKAASAKAKK